MAKMRYIPLYEETLRQRNAARREYLEKEFQSVEIVKYNRFKKIAKNFWYFYLVGNVVIATILMIICRYHNELFNKIWSIYFAILALVSALLGAIFGVIKQILLQKSIDAREFELTYASKAAFYANELAKVTLTITALSQNNVYLGQFKDKNEQIKEANELIQTYIECLNEKHQKLITNEDIVGVFQAQIIDGENRG